MADQQSNPTPPAEIFALSNEPGVRRDGTDLDSEHWSDAQWVRFQRGKPRKIGGFRAMSDQLYGPVRALHFDARAAVNTIHTFTRWGVEQLQVDNSGIVSGLADRTPAGFTPNVLLAWQSASIFQSGGAGTPTLVASATPDLDSLASDAAGSIYSGDITLTAALTAVADGSGPITVSGGICVLQPFLFVYGSNGLIRNSNPNDISAGTGWTTGGANKANTANVAGSKVVKGLQMRGGSQSPAGLFWALDSLIRVTYVGGTTLWNYDTLSDDTTVLSKSGIVEYDNSYYWVGTDRFYVFNGVVQELPNDMNLNWFFDNLNYAQRQKVWALKVPRFGEIWWFFPSSMSTECDSAVIYNVREKAWYDTRIDRSAGFPARVFPRPIMAQPGADTTAIKYTPTAGMFNTGGTVTGGTSGATGMMKKITATQLNLTNVVGTFVSGEALSDGVGDTGTTTSAPFTQALATVWDHENGVDEVGRQDVKAIDSYVTTNNMTWVTGSPNAPPQGQGPNYQMRLLRVEPDFIMSGNMNIDVIGVSFAQDAVPTHSAVPYNYTQTTPFIDMREQRREMTLKFRSNEVGGNFQMGLILLTAEPGDERG